MVSRFSSRLACRALLHLTSVLRFGLLCLFSGRFSIGLPLLVLSTRICTLVRRRLMRSARSGKKAIGRRGGRLSWLRCIGFGGFGRRCGDCILIMSYVYV